MDRAQIAFIFLGFLLILNPASSFDKATYCMMACQQGTGGNFCQCRASHFAGKRKRTKVDGMEKINDSRY